MKSGIRRIVIITAAALALAGGIYAWMRGGKADSADVATFVVQRGNLQINVLQGGEIRALKNYEVKSEIETPTKIISLVPEGTLISEDDVKEGKVLVELDGSDIKDRISTHDIEFQTTVAAYIDADENREIVRSENQSLERDTRNAAMFALMDFEKYLGKSLASGILAKHGLPANVEAFEKEVLGMQASASVTTKDKAAAAMKSKQIATPAPKPAAPQRKEPAIVRVDYLALLDGDSSTDGDAQQKLSQLKGDLLLHQGELEQAKDVVANSEKLAAKEFITRSALKTDQVNFEKIALTVRTAEIALDLFRKYEFPKQCEQFLSAYQEALHKLQRTIRANRSKMAQAESKFETAKRRYDMELAKKEELERQLAACVIKATQPGLVAYGQISSGSSYRYNEPIEEGAAVRLRQTILTIPDMTHMGVHVSVHESQVKKVRINQRVRVRVDAEPGKELYGTVAEVAVLPDSTSSRYTPNLKVYPCNVHIEGTHDWLKPGMNAKVEIIVDDLADVLFVPVQSIEVDNDHHFCYVASGGDLQRREVATGLFNDEFIQVLKGLEIGENVALTLPKRSLLDDVPDMPAHDTGGKAKPPSDKDAKAKDHKSVAAK